MLSIIIDSVDETLVYPHDYGGRTVSSIWEEKQFNEMIGANAGKQAFIRRINTMALDLPKKIHVAMPANQVCGAKIMIKTP